MMICSVPRGKLTSESWLLELKPGGHSWNQIVKVNAKAMCHGVKFWKAASCWGFRSLSLLTFITHCLCEGIWGFEPSEKVGIRLARFLVLGCAQTLSESVWGGSLPDTTLSPAVRCPRSQARLAPKWLMPVNSTCPPKSRLESSIFSISKPLWPEILWSCKNFLEGIWNLRGL